MAQGMFNMIVRVKLFQKLLIAWICCRKFQWWRCSYHWWPSFSPRHVKKLFEILTNNDVCFNTNVGIDNWPNIEYRWENWSDIALKWMSQQYLSDSPYSAIVEATGSALSSRWRTGEWAKHSCNDGGHGTTSHFKLNINAVQKCATMAVMFIRCRRVHICHSERDVLKI